MFNNKNSFREEKNANPKLKATKIESTSSGANHLQYICINAFVFDIQKKDLVFEKERAALISSLVSELPIFTRKELWRKYLLKY